jgi:starvation-inducible DNA-binding protein
MKPEIGITDTNRQSVANELAKILADEFLLYTKTRKAHWNIEAPDFLTVHRFFAEQYAQIETIIDDVAERIRTLGHYADATLSNFLNLTHLTEETRDKNDSAGFMKSLLEDHETIIIHLRENVTRFATKWHDQGTADFITGLMETHEKMAWLLRSHLK